MPSKMRRITVEFENGKKLICDVDMEADNTMRFELLPTSSVWTFDADKYEPPREQKFLFGAEAIVKKHEIEEVKTIRQLDNERSENPNLGYRNM